MLRDTVTLPSETDLPSFRAAARSLIAKQQPPEQVEWQVASSTTPDLFGAADLPSLFDDNADSPPAPNGTGCPTPEVSPAASTEPASSTGLRVPPAFLALCRTAILHSDPGRFGLLYRLLWRLLYEPALRHDPLDPDRLQANALTTAVRRDMHKMTAFVRFRPVAGAEDGTPTLHTAWFEPQHHIVEAVSPFFVRRFTQMHWSILTPLRSVLWNGEQLRFGPGARQQDAPPADAGEALWLTYYANIFNPARLKLDMMQKEMPRRYWANLPEARLIGELSARALERSSTMVSQPATTPRRRIPQAAPTAAVLRDAPNGEPATPLRSIADLKSATDRCRECPIGQYATQSVVGTGPHHARLMVVGEQPGDQEDLRGLPFVGPAGRLFDRALAELGWPRERIYVTNAVKHFKYELRGKRRIHKTPAQQEVDACLHWLEDEMRLVAPQAIVALGATAARALLGRPVAVMKERGQWFTDPRGQRVLVTLHPSALLRADPEHGAENFARWVEDLAHASDLVHSGT